MLFSNKQAHDLREMSYSTTWNFKQFINLQSFISSFDSMLNIMISAHKINSNIHYFRYITVNIKVRDKKIFVSTLEQYLEMVEIYILT